MCGICGKFNFLHKEARSIVANLRRWREPFGIVVLTTKDIFSTGPGIRVQTLVHH